MSTTLETYRALAVNNFGPGLFSKPNVGCALADMEDR